MKKYLLTIVALIVLAAGHSAFAALSAIITPSSSTAIINQPINYSIAIANTGSSALTLNNLYITASYNGATNSRVPSAFSVYPPSSVSLAANATTTYTASGVFFAPSTGITGSGTGKYYVGALLYTSDGSVTSAATGAQMTVNPIPLPAYERQ